MVKNIFSKFIKNITGKISGEKGVLAFDLGSHSIKIAEVQTIKGKPVLTNFGQGRTYKNIIINGIINDLQYFSSNLKNILDVLKPNFNKVNISFPYEIVIFDFFKSPHIPTEEEIKEKINEEIPYRIEDVYYSYYIVPQKDSYQVLYLVAKKEVVDKYEAVVNNLNYQINNIDADFINLHNIIEVIYGKHSKIIVDWGNSKIKFLFCDNEIPIYNKELFNMGFINLKKMIMKELKLDEDTTEALIVNPERGHYPQLKEIYKRYIIEVLQELDTAIKFVISKFGLSIENIFLIGGGARIPDICNIFKEYFKIDTQLVDLEKYMKFSNDFDPEYKKVVNTQGVIACATALKDFI